MTPSKKVASLTDHKFGSYYQVTLSDRIYPIEWTDIKMEGIVYCGPGKFYGQ